MYSEVEVGVHSITKCNYPRSYMSDTTLLCFQILLLFMLTWLTRGTKPESYADQSPWIHTPCFSLPCSNQIYIKEVTVVLIQVS